ncbi:hypothetical protein RJ640_024412 [Escallonia rubra]|uniref:Chromo domain-containing protein n=1 Tax=Escallonia rubra TaxID=112253 RepID=A0AA88R0D2_9ASTE|nr:hypothetical protein RJ640_024412 [Escallonia rubra]
MCDVKDRVGMVEQNLQMLQEHVLEELETLKRAVGAQDELRASEYMKKFTTPYASEYGGGRPSLQLRRRPPKLVQEGTSNKGMKNVDEAIAMAELLTEGPHWARDYPRQGKLEALVKEKEKEEFEREAMRIGSLQVLNAFQTKNVLQVPTGEGQAPTSKGLLYVEAKLKGKPAGLVDFFVAHMDDFKVVLGLDFLRQVNALVSTYNSAMHIMEKGAACVVPMFRETSSSKTFSSMWLSGMRLVEGVEEEKAKKAEGTCLANLKREDHVVPSTEQPPKEMVRVLKRRKDTLPRDLPREVDDVLEGNKNTLRKEHERVVRRYEGPFRVMAKVGKASYRVQLPPKSKIQLVFHASLLKPRYRDVEDARCGKSHRAPTTKVKTYVKVAEYVFGDKLERSRGSPPQQHYLVKWKGLPEHEATWEPAEELWQFKDLVDCYHEEVATRSPPN